MKRQKFSIKEAFAYLRDADLLAQGQAAGTAMTGNANFPNLTNAVTTVLDATAAFGTSMTDFKATGSDHDMAVKAEKRELLIKALHALAVLINLEADGNRALLETTSFPLAKEKGAGRRKREGIKLEAGKGFLKVSFGSVKGAGAYLIQYIKTPVVAEGALWNNIHITATSYVVTGLESGQLYTFRMAGINGDPNLVFSDEVSSYVL